MRMKSFVLGGAALLSVAGLSAPALARVHHHSLSATERAERKQTDALNAQQLALARGQQPMQQQAEATMPEQNNAMTATPQTAAPESTAPQTTAPTEQQPPANPQPNEQPSPQPNGSSPQQ